MINEADTVAISINKTKTHEVLEPQATGKFSYQYDAAGNMSYDEFKDVTIRYNHLNLPDTVIAPGRGKMVNTYLADGTLLTRTILDTNGNVKKKLDYCGELLIENDTLKYIFHSEGYAKPKNEKFAYFYILKDHLGNTRVVMDGSGKVLQEFAYYPFGMQIEELAFIDTTMQNPYEYSYNGKEEVNNFGLGWMDYGGRANYDPELAIWRSIDPAIEDNHFEWSPFTYVYNNPMRNIDPFGLDSLDAVALQQAAEKAVNKITTKYGTQSAQCNRGVATVFEDLTGSSELNDKTANEQFDHMENSEDFETVDQEDSQELSNDGQIVIAAKKEEKESGHIVLGVPGEEKSSDSWNEKVPLVMDTGGNKRAAEQRISGSWKASEKSDITYFKYTGKTYTSRTYSGGTSKGVTIKGKKPDRPKSVIMGVQLKK